MEVASQLNQRLLYLQLTDHIKAQTGHTVAHLFYRPSTPVSHAVNMWDSKKLTVYGFGQMDTS